MTFDDDLTEVTEMNTPRVDLVSKAANGTRFLLAKSASDPSIFSEADVLALAKAQEGDMTDSTPDLVKADEMPTEVDSEEVDAPGDPTDPDSAAWEAVDAANAVNGLTLAVALKRILEAARDREATEVAMGSDDDDDQENVWDLSDALTSLDCIIDVLAPFAISEQAESDDRADEPVVKAGRVLSSANETRIRQAQSLLEDVVGSLPAPVESVVKADDEQLTLVYSKNGSVLGAVKASAITTFANSDDSDDSDSSDDESASESSDSDTSADEADADSTESDAQAEQPADSADEKTIPGTQTVQSPVEGDSEDVKKGLPSEVLDVLKEMSDTIAKLAGEKSEQAEEIADLKETVRKIAQSPDDRRSPLLNGGTGTAHEVARDGGDPLAALRKAVEEAPTPEKRAEAQQNLAYESIKSRFLA